MTDDAVLQLIQKELNEKNLAVTAQYLEIHSPVYKDGILVISRIDRNEKDRILVYLPVTKQQFYFVFYIDSQTEQIIGISTEAHNQIFIIAIMSDFFIDDFKAYSSLELELMKNLNLVYAWKKGEKMKGRARLHEDNGLKFEPIPEPDTLENKLRRLLDILEENREGMYGLSQKSTFVGIQTFIAYHQGNQLLGSFVLDKALIDRINQFNISLEFDISAWGNGFK